MEDPKTTTNNSARSTSIENPSIILGQIQQIIDDEQHRVDKQLIKTIMEYG